MTTTKPTDETVAALVDRLDEDLAELFQERASVRELDGGFKRTHAEALALLDVVDRHPDALCGVTVFAFEIGDATHFVVTTDRDLGLDHIERSGGTARRADMARVVREEFGGLAALASVD